MKQLMQAIRRKTFAVSNEFYPFLILLFVFNIYIWCTLQYEDTFLSPLSDESIKNLSPAAFEDTIARLSPHFATFERNCKADYRPFTLSTWDYVTSVLSMDWKYRLPYLYMFYRFALCLETKFQCKLKKFTTMKYEWRSRAFMLLCNALIYFIFCMLDVLYIRWQYIDDDQSETVNVGLLDYSQVTLSQRLLDIIFIYIRVHPTSSWFVRLSHGISYPFTIYAVSRPNVSDFTWCHMVSIALWLFHVGGLAHVVDVGDMHLRCVRRSFIWSTRSTSISGEAIRMSVAPYLNIVCLSIDCAKFVFS